MRKPHGIRQAISTALNVPPVERALAAPTIFWRSAEFGCPNAGDDGIMSFAMRHNTPRFKTDLPGLPTRTPRFKNFLIAYNTRLLRIRTDKVICRDHSRAARATRNYAKALRKCEASKAYRHDAEIEVRKSRHGFPFLIHCQKWMCPITRRIDVERRLERGNREARIIAKSPRFAHVTLSHQLIAAESPLASHVWTSLARLNVRYTAFRKAATACGCVGGLAVFDISHRRSTHSRRWNDVFIHCHLLLEFSQFFGSALVPSRLRQAWIASARDDSELTEFHFQRPSTNIRHLQNALRYLLGIQKNTIGRYVAKYEDSFVPPPFENLADPYDRERRKRLKARGPLNHRQFYLMIAFEAWPGHRVRWFGSWSGLGSRNV